ncbi:MAG: hydroxymethylglutaryl-CoA lyase [Chloroflexi bacterium]|nr:hydroxymethylglutaryl-CoA lyase [Chloroflexota bacterium]
MSIALPHRVTVKEEGMRDGLQNEKAILPTETKVEIINALLDTGLPRISVTSFAHPKWVPQLQDGAEVLRRIRRAPGVTIVALVPNLRGLERAIAVKQEGVKLDEIDLVFSASEGHNRSNVNKGVDESLAEMPGLIETAHGAGLAVNLTISTAFGCAIDGVVPAERVIALARRAHDGAPDMITLGDTPGVANPRQSYELFSRLREALPQARLGAHFHDTRGTGLSNVLAAMQASIDSFDGCIGGIGGCPFSPGATGNVSTEDVVNMLHEMGIETGVDLSKLFDCARMMQKVLGRELPGRAMHAHATPCWPAAISPSLPSRPPAPGSGTR